MENKIFLDINIVIDLVEPTRNNHDKALLVLKKCIDDDFAIHISEDMISTVYYLIPNKNKSIRFFKGILDEWKIVPFGKNVLQQAFDFALENNLDLEDTLQCFCAKENGCSLFLTSDKKFVDCGIKIVNYDEFLGVEYD